MKSQFVTKFGLSLASALVLSACANTGQPSISTQPPKAVSYASGVWPEKTLPEIAKALRDGQVTSEDLVRDYLDRIERIDRSGPTLQSVLTVNPNALQDARALDAKRAAGQSLGPLHGVPILLKDNIESRDPMPTTAGALVLAENVTGRDSPLVAGLRNAGAVILGKTNLSQWANFRSNDSISGWTALGARFVIPICWTAARVAPVPGLVRPRQRPSRRELSVQKRTGRLSAPQT